MRQSREKTCKAIRFACFVRAELSQKPICDKKTKTKASDDKVGTETRRGCDKMESIRFGNLATFADLDFFLFCVQVWKVVVIMCSKSGCHRDIFFDKSSCATKRDDDKNRNSL